MKLCYTALLETRASASGAGSYSKWHAFGRGSAMLCSEAVRNGNEKRESEPLSSMADAIAAVAPVSSRDSVFDTVRVSRLSTLSKNDSIDEMMILHGPGHALNM